jgi:hydrogenase maturation protease
VNESSPARRVVLGLGNPDRGDDGAGRAVARLLRGHLPADIGIVEQGGEMAQVIGALEGATAAFLIDASRCGGSPGRIRRFDAAAAVLPAGAGGTSTHGLGLPEAIELARALGRLPARCVVYAIEAERFDPGAPLSAPVSAAAAEVAARLQAEIAEIEREGIRAR